MPETSLKSLLSRAQSDLQRLEFLGDAVLGAAVAEALYRRFADASEAELTLMRAELVSTTALAELARQHGLDEDASGGQTTDKGLADRLEAAVGMLFVEEGYRSCLQHLLDWLQPVLAELDLDTDYRHPKTQLQERLMAHGCQLPDYSTQVLDDGRVEVNCSLSWQGQKHRASAIADNARQAGRLVAEQALKMLDG